MTGHKRSESPSVPDLTYDIAREREFYRYYQPLSLGLEHDLNGDIHSGPREVRPSPDRALTAFAQLATLRLNVRRSFISFFDRQNQYFVAEATQSLLLQDDSVSVPGDELIYGATIIPKKDSICQHTIALPLELDQDSKDVSVLVVPDLRKDKRFKDLEYTLSKGSVFYAGVAIVSPAGHRIGAYCIIDDKPREGGLTSEEIAFMKDMATTVMVHMDMLRARSESVKGERMVRGLGSFVEGKSSMDEWWMEPSNNLAGRNTPPSSALSPEIKQQWADKQYSMHHKTASQDSRSLNGSPLRKQQGSRPRWSTQSHPDGELSRSESEGAVKPLSEDPKAKKTEKQDTLSIEVKATFGRAAAIIRESLQVDGVCCFDAKAGHTFGGLIDQEDISRPKRRQGSISDGENTPSKSAKEEPVIEDKGKSGETNPSLRDLQDDHACEVLGFSTNDFSSINGDLSTKVTDGMTEAFLRSLLRRFPHGKIINFDESGNTPSLTGEATIEETESGSKGTSEKRSSLHAGEDVYMRQMFPSVRSLALVPLWDSRQRFFSGCVTWTTDPHRIFTSHSELSYLAAFGDSIMAEVSRIDAKLADKSKSDFISSISHELRSPLHGILGSVECLQDTVMDAFQENLVHTMETCGKTLLDTIDHLLDFAKINNFTRKGRPGQKTRDGDDTKKQNFALDVDVDLSVITEEVLETVFAGHNMLKHGMSSESADGPNSSEATQLSQAAQENKFRDQPSEKQNEVSVIVDINKAESSHWIFRTQAGAWRRVLMNIFGNSLKYTHSGFIKVLLEAEPLPTKNKGGRSKVILTVTDSGKGISQEYLKNSLFVPFAQEDSLQPGTGLGLAITATIIRSMGGEIDVKSEEGKGTETTVTLELEHAPLSQESLEQSIITSAVNKTQGLRIGFVGFQADSSGKQPVARSRSPENARHYFMRSFHRLCHNWFKMDMNITQSLNHVDADIFLATETGYAHIQHELRSKMDEQSGKEAQAFLADTPLLVLCDTIAAANTLVHNKRSKPQAHVVEFISQPCGPRKLAKALTICLERQDAAKNPDKLEPTLHEALGEDSHEGGKDEKRERQTLDADEQTEGRQSKDEMDGAQKSHDHSQSKDSGDGMQQVDHPNRPKSIPKNISHLGADNTPASPTLPRPPKESSTVTPQNIRNVLLVDDNKINLQLLVTFMKKSGHNFSTASNGLEALEVYKKKSSTSLSENKCDGETNRNANKSPNRGSGTKDQENERRGSNSKPDGQPGDGNNNSTTTTTSTSESRTDKTGDTTDFNNDGVNDKTDDKHQDGGEGAKQTDNNDGNLAQQPNDRKPDESDESNPKSSSQASNTPQTNPSPFDIILMDLSMPIMGGLESTRHIRAFERANAIEPTTVIALTGLASASAQQEAYSSGIDTFMTKPVKLKELAKILSEGVV